MSLNKLDKEKIIDIIDFIISEDGCDPETFQENKGSRNYLC
jgi:hypothetical protein